MSENEVCWVQPDFERYADPKILRIATLLEEEGFKVNFIDFSWDGNLSHVEKRLESIPSKILITTMLLPRTLRIAEAAKKVGKTTVIYSPGLVKEMRLFVSHPAFDYAVISRNEFVLPKLLKKLLFDESVSNVHGIVYEENGEVVCNERLGENRFDRLPPINWNLIDVEKNLYPTLFGPTIHLQFSKGCHRFCPFCRWRHCQGKLNYMSVERSLMEIEQVLSKTDRIKCVLFEDIDFTFDKERVMDFCEGLLDKKIKISWICNLHPQDADEEMIKKMREAGCREVLIGFETGSPRVRERIGKSPDLKIVERTIEICKKNDVLPLLFVVLGFPGESQEDLKETLRFVLENKPFSVRPLFYRPILDSNFLSYARKFGFVEPSSLEEYENLIYDLPHFTDRRMAKKIYRFLLLYSDFRVLSYVFKRSSLTQFKAVLKEYKVRILRRVYKTNYLSKILSG